MIERHLYQRGGLLLTIVLASGFLLAANSTAWAQIKYRPGDRVECDSTETGKWWTEGTIMPFQKGDFGGGKEPDGSWYRFKADYNSAEYPCKPSFVRPVAGAVAKNQVKAGEAQRTDKQRPSKESENLATGDFLACPVEQKQVNGSARPDAELFKKIARCKKGEKAVRAGDEGAVKVEIGAFQIGASRPWSYSQDRGNAKPGALVYPVKATYTVKTLYRNATEVEEGSVRILNFYVNAFGEWQIGSEEPIKSPTTKRIPK